MDSSVPSAMNLNEQPHRNAAVIDRKFEYWKNQLLDLSKRNKMINYRETKRTTLKILEPDFAELFNRLAVNEEKLTFQRSINKDSDIRAFSMLTLLETLGYPIPVYIGDIKTEGSLLERKITLNNLRSKAKLAKDEQGTNILYLSFGFLEWKENNSANATWLKSPVLMMPVSLRLESIQSPFTLSRYDDEIEVNPTLDYYFDKRYGVGLPAFELKDEDSIEQYMQATEQIADKNGWKLTREVGLGLFSFLKISMYHDIDNSYERMIRNPVVRAITGNAESVNNIPGEFNGFDYDLVAPSDCYQVVNADSSQQEAIMLSKAGVSFVMQGPPGTGKSQTITNIIAETLAGGKKVLFVSEKAAALEVVYKRLNEVGLSDFCLALHSHKANKKEILESIAANLKLNRLRIKESVMAELSELFHDRQSLNQYVQELHAEILPLEKSLHEAFGELSALNTPSMPFHLDSPASISAADYRKMHYNVSRYAKALGRLGVRLSENPWSGTNIKQLDEKLRSDFMQNLSGIPEKFNVLRDYLSNFQNAFGLSEVSSWVYANELVSSLTLFENLPLFSSKWSDRDVRNKASSTARERNSLLSRYQNGRADIKRTFDESVFEIDIDDLLVSMHNALEFIRIQNYYDFSDADILNATTTATEKLNVVIAEIESLVASYEKLEEITGIYAPCTIKNLQALGGICAILATSPILQSDWCIKAGFESAKKLLGDAKSRSDHLIETRSEVLGVYADDVLDTDTTACLDRFTNLYTDNAKALISQYEHDLNSLKNSYKGNTDPDHNMILRLLDTLVDLNNLNTDLNKSDSELAERFPNEYMGIDTLWENMDRLFEQISEQIERAQPASKELVSNWKGILANWESGVFDIDAEAMLLRFRTKYTNFLKIVKSSYRRDMLLLKGLYKVFGEKLSNATAVALLQELKAIAEKEKKFSQNANLIPKHFSKEFDGAHTDWDILKTAYGQVSSIKDKISRIAAEIKSMRKSISEDWKNEYWKDNIYAIGITEIEQMRFRFSMYYTPSFYETMRQYKEDMKFFIGLRKENKNLIDDAEIVRLLRNINTITSETHWFDDEAYNLLVKTFGDDFTGYDTKWDDISKKINFAGLLFNELNCDAIPETVQNIVTDISTHDRECPAIAATLEKISNEHLDRIVAESHSFVPLQGETNIKDVLLSALYSLRYGFTALNDSVKQLQYCALSEMPYDLALDHAQDIQKSNRLKKQLLAFGVPDSEMFGDRYIGIETNWNAIIDDINSISAFFETPESGLLTDRFVQLASNDIIKRIELSAVRVTLGEYIDELTVGCNAFFAVFDEEADLQNLPLAVLSDKMAACMDNFMLLDSWLICMETRATCDEIGLSDFTAKIEQSDNTIEDVVGVFKRGFYTAWVESVKGGKKAVEQFHRNKHDELIERFVLMDDKQLEIARERIRQNIIANIPDSNRISNATDELSILLHELGKKRGFMPLRKLFKAIPNLLLKLKPCLMMSPLSVAYFLEAESYEFDTVIFDEASQIFPQDAIGAILRGKQVVIAGDSKQLPPTNFFAASTSNGDDDYDNEYEDEQEDEIYDSILEEAANILPNKRLLWHYRSKHENLIAFSNRNIYDNDLITFPGSIEGANDTGVEFVFVEDGIYEGKGRNTGEACRCVELVKAHIEKHPKRSLGIIAFSESQQKTIAHEIQKFREQNPKYEEFFAEEKEDEFFVKNLENVQGDERDTIIFSVSYAKTKDQRDKNQTMSLRFGPLGQKGGERRLNVAITRAKHNIKLVSSIVPSDIDLSRTESEGVKMLRSYIEFAMKGPSSFQSAHSSDEDDILVDVVSQFLISQGYMPKKYVGCSGYKIDIAIMHPEMENCFAAGIECDGLSYRAAKTARDRDRLRKSVLESMGWNIYRVWSPEWMVNPEIERKKLIEFVEKAISGFSTQSQSLSDETDEKKPVQAYEDAEALTEIVYEEVPNDYQGEMTADGNPYGFGYYVETNWKNTPQTASGKITDIDAIKYIIGIEQPISIELLYQRMAKAYGNQKATVAIKNKVDAAMRHPTIRELIIKDNDGFVTLKGFVDLKVRIPSPGSSKRPINFISPDEVGLAMITIASRSIGIFTDNLMDATAKALGYARKGDIIMPWLNKAFDKLVKERRIKIIDGKVNVTEGEYRG